MFNNYSMLLRSSCRSSVVCCNKVAASALTPMLVPDSRNITTNNRNIIDIKNNNNNNNYNNNSIVKQNYFDITDDFLRIQAQKLLRDKKELIKFGEPRRNKLFSSFATSSSSYLKSLVAKFPFTASNTSSSFFFSPQYRHSFHSRQARTFFSQTTTSTLFNSKRFCSTSTSPPPQQEEQQQHTNEEPAATKNSKDVISDERYFNDEVVKHVVTEVSKNKILKDAFQEIDRALSGSNENKIEASTAATRYETISAALNSGAEFHSGLAKTIRDWQMLGPIQAALNMCAEIASRKSAVIAEEDYSLLFGTIYLLCSIASVSPRLDVRNINDDNVEFLAPYIRFIRLTDVVASTNWPRLPPQRQSIMCALLVSTLQKVEDVQAKRYEELPQVVHFIKTAHDNLRNSKVPSVQEQCDFTKTANAYFACSAEGRQTCQKRFVSPKAGSGITNCFRSQWDPEDEGPLRNQFRPDILNIVSGSSGSGKTISSLISGASAGIPVYNILLHAKVDCSELDLQETEKGRRDSVALELLIRGILKALSSSGKHLPEFHASEWERDHRTNANSTKVGFDPSLSRFKGILRIIVDEIGTHPQFLRALCAVWREWSDDIANWLGIPAGNLQLVAVGTGSDNFEFTKHGSIMDSYKVLIVVRGAAMFKQLFRQQLKSIAANQLKQLPPAERLFEMLFGEKADPNALHPSFPRSEDPVFRCLLRLVTSARCAAIILSLVYQTFVTNMKSAVAKDSPLASTVTPEWSEVQLRATVSYWCVATVAIFSSKSSLASLRAEERHYALGKAIAYSLNRNLGMDGTNDEPAAQWYLYGVKFGLLSDTARVLKNLTPDVQGAYEQTWFDAAGQPRTLTFGVVKDEARFQVDDAFVMMYLIMSETVSNGVFAKSYSNVDLLFKEAVFDFQRLAVQFGQRHPVFGSASHVPILADGAASQNTNSSAASSRFEAKIVLLRDALIEPCHIPIAPDATGFTPPHLLYGLGCDTVHSATLSFGLEESTLENAVIPPAIQLAARIWRDKIHQGHAVALLNGASATMADTIVLAKNRIILTQCKHGEKIDSATIHEEIFKMRRKKLLSLLCWCVATSPNDTTVEVFYVIAGGDKKNINTDYPSKTSYGTLESTIKMDGTTISFDETKIHQVYQLHESTHLAYAFDGDSKKVLPYSPILRSKLPSAETVCDCYTTMKHVVQLTSISKSSCPASEMLATKLTKN